MINKVEQILSNINTPVSSKLPIRYVLRPDISGDSKVGISYHFFNQGYSLHGDGEGEKLGGSIQVDIFSKVDYTDVLDQVLNLMKLNKFRLADMRDSDNSFRDVRYYHKILIFNYLEEEVK